MYLLHHLLPAFLSFLSAIYAACIYKYPVKLDPLKIKLCVSSRWVEWEQKTVQGMIHRGTKIFCSKTSLVNDFFILMNLTIPAHGNLVDVKLIEDKCDILISTTSGRFTYELYNRTKVIDRPLVAAIPSNIDILLIWSDKMLWKQWMIDKGFEKHVAKSIDLNNATYPFVMKEGLSENSQGVNIIQNPMELQAKLKYFQEKKVTNYYGEEALTGMGRAQGIFYISAFEGRVLNIQCFLLIGLKEDIVRQNFTDALFIAGRPKNLTTVKGHSQRINYAELNITSVLHKIAYRGHYTGIFCAEFKMNKDKTVIFMEFNARICFSLTQVDKYFLEAYLPLAYSIQQKIRMVKRTPRTEKLINKSQSWFFHKDRRNKARGYFGISRKATRNVERLPKFSLYNLSLDATLK